MFEGQSEQGHRPTLESMTARQTQSKEVKRSAGLDAKAGESVDLEPNTDTEPENVSGEKSSLDAVRGNYLESQ